MSLPTGWQDQPTTDASEAYMVSAATKKYGSKVGAAYKKWYDAARKKDPKITPSQSLAFIVAYDVSGAVAAEAVTVTGGTATVSNPATGKLSTASSTGVAQSAADAASKIKLPGPLSGLEAIGAFFNALTNPHTWVRILMVGGGVVLMTAGIMQMFPKVTEGTLGAVTKIASKVPVV